MVVFSDILLLLGSVTLFLFGLTKLSGEIGGLCGGKVDKIVRYATKNRVGGALAGMFITSVLQSSVATNVIAITFVEKGVIDFVACAAVIMGTNIGTTVTAQIVSLSNVFDFTSPYSKYISYFVLLCCRSQFSSISPLVFFATSFALCFKELVVVSVSFLK